MGGLVYRYKEQSMDFYRVLGLLGLSWLMSHTP